MDWSRVVLVSSGYRIGVEEYCLAPGIDWSRVVLVSSGYRIEVEEYWLAPGMGLE